ncbi:MAG: DUF1566 domain-containing protein [Treponema sp.]|jgi:hypothetical protein|nr:DUF1566 domain-containing protein [Treponema sp.]
MKKTVLMFIFWPVCLAVFGQNTFNVGKAGPAGGTVFYDKGVFSNGWRYLEAAPPETEFKVEWGAAGQTVGGTGTTIGSGKRNTQLIADKLRQLGESGKAAQLCASLNIDGYKDWFLPSRDELDLMYRNLKMEDLGGFGNGWYWSSSENYDIFGWGQRFSTGYQYHKAAKDDAYLVRAVRAF